MSVDRYLSRRQAPGYDCLAFARDVWAGLTGEDLRGRLDILHPDPRRLRVFERLSAPVDPCLVLMRRPRSQPHVGVYVRGRVLHLDAGGAKHVPLELVALSFLRVEFYR